MANNADVTYILTGSEADCKALEEEVRKILYLSPYRGWLGYLNCLIYPEQRPLYTFYNWTDDRSNTLKYPFWDCRGTIEDVSEVYPLNPNVEHPSGATHGISLYCDEAWHPHSEIVHYFARKFNCTMNYMCIEPGGMVYVLHNPDRVFDAKWFVNICLSGEEGLYQDINISDLNWDPDCIWPKTFLEWMEQNNIEIAPDNICEVIDQFDDYLQETDESGESSASIAEFDHSDWDDFDSEVPSLESVIEKNIQEYERKLALKNNTSNNNTNA